MSTRFVSNFTSFVSKSAHQTRETRTLVLTPNFFKKGADPSKVRVFPVPGGGRDLCDIKEKKTHSTFTLVKGGDPCKLRGSRFPGW